MKYSNKFSKPKFRNKSRFQKDFKIRNGSRSDTNINTLQVEGRNPVLEYLRNKPREIKLVYIQRELTEDKKISEIYEILGKEKIDYTEVDKSQLDRISSTETHQGIIASLKEFNYLKIGELISKINNSNREPFFLIIRENLYEHNLGAILRTAASCGVNGIIVTPKSEVTANVIRTSMGATATLNICRASLFDAIRELNQNNIPIIAIELTGDKYYYETNLTGPIVFIIGGEDHGISNEILEKCQGCVKIPMLGKINSLNMSVAAGIILYDKLRQEASA